MKCFTTTPFCTVAEVSMKVTTDTKIEHVLKILKQFFQDGGQAIKTIVFTQQLFEVLSFNLI